MLADGLVWSELGAGDEATHFGATLSGTIHVSVLGDGAVRQSLGRLKTGDTFNELALMTGDVVIADFLAESPCEARSRWRPTACGTSCSKR
jgi:CRP-like cAMP-binding protein